MAREAQLLGLSICFVLFAYATSKRWTKVPSKRDAPIVHVEESTPKDDEENRAGEDVEPGETWTRDGRLVRQINAVRVQSTTSLTEKTAFLQRILENIVGESVMIETCFGPKRALYCDWTGSAKALRFVENYIQDVVLPLYANTHSLESRMGLQTSCFREEAREIIQLACNANRKKDAVIFVGNGSTGAIQKIIDILGLNVERTNEAEENCVVFVGPHEHTSNLVLWRESNAKVVAIPEDPNRPGQLNLEMLSVQLDRFASWKMKIGSFSACSNVTGVLEDVDTVTGLLHQKGALAFWDYASAAPYCAIDMNPVSVGPDRAYLQKDAIFISSHKFVGGVGGTGLLIAKRVLFNNRVPHNCGGGTVYFVDEDSHRFLSDVVSREEGGTPNIVGAIRAGLAFKIKQSVGTDIIRARDEQIVIKALKVFASLREHVVLLGLGTSAVPTSILPTFSFLIKRNGRYLHHNFVVALLSDLYGIQCRGGCLCAGPYVQSLLGLSKSDVARLEEALVSATHQREQYRPGVTRISLPYFFDDPRVDYVLRAIKDVAEHGWRLLPLYRYENTAGEWGFKRMFQKFPQRIWLADCFSQIEIPRTSAISFEEQGAAALELMLNPPPEAFKVEGGELAEEDWIRWFLAPWEASAELRGDQVMAPKDPFVRPDRYSEIVRNQNREMKEMALKPAESVVVACPLRPATSRRDLKQPKRFSSGPVRGTSERALAFQETVEQHLSITGQMTQAELFPVVPSKIMRLVVQASKEWTMINPGDRLLLGLSGGKDSLCLLHVLLQIQKRAPFKFEIACCTIDPGAGDAFNPSPLIPYVESLGIKYHYEKTDIFDNAKETLPNASSYCSFCARMKRGTLYRVAKEQGYTALVLAQHLDDFAESFFMSVFRNGSLRTMKANYVENKGEVRVIRPLCYVRERDTKDFSYSAKLPVINENCPACFSAPTERERVKQFLKDQETLVPSFFESVRKALLPLMDGNVYSFHHEIENRLQERRDVNTATKDAKVYGAANRDILPKRKRGGPDENSMTFSEL